MKLLGTFLQGSKKGYRKRNSLTLKKPKRETKYLGGNNR